VPWFFSVTVKLTVLPAAGLLGVQLTGAAIRSELWTGATTSEFRTGLSLTTATLPTQPGGAGLGPDALSISPLITTLLSDTYTLSVSPTVLTIAATTTVFLVAQATFSAGTMSAFGTLNALLI